MQPAYLILDTSGPWQLRSGKRGKWIQSILHIAYCIVAAGAMHCNGQWWSLVEPAQHFSTFFWCVICVIMSLHQRISYLPTNNAKYTPKCERYKIQWSPDTKINMRIWSRRAQAHKYMQMFKVLISFHQVLFYNRFKLWQMCTVLEWQKWHFSFCRSNVVKKTSARRQCSCCSLVPLKCWESPISIRVWELTI